MAPDMLYRLFSGIPFIIGYARETVNAGVKNDNFTSVSCMMPILSVLKPSHLDDKDFMEEFQAAEEYLEMKMKYKKEHPFDDKY